MTPVAWIWISVIWAFAICFCVFTYCETLYRRTRNVNYTQTYVGFDPDDDPAEWEDDDEELDSSTFAPDERKAIIRTEAA